jgi:hypothetical protein
VKRPNAGPRDVVGPGIGFLAVLASVAAVGAGLHASPPDERYRVEALSIDSPIRLDGRLDEPAWRRAQPASGFTQREPEPGAPATERTEIRFVFTPRTLYVGVHAFDNDPERIIAREMRRDGSLFRDDSVIILLDTFDDDRNTYFFETNPVGARTDSLVTDEGRDSNFEWDGVWDVVSRRTDDGWVAEIAIPFSTLRFDPSAETWGLQVRRLIRHKNEEVFWAPVLLDADLFRVSLYGSLAGIEGVKPGLNLNVKPYVTVSDEVPPEDEPIPVDDGFDAGLDVKWGVTRGLSLDLTINTDFAETEVDAQEINLTRFSLFFPEKREFFLENAGIFEFGPDQGSGRPLLKVFFSRRIGLGEAGREIPIDFGLRLTGRSGPWNIGALGVRTDAVVPVQEADLSGVPRTGWGTVRLKRNVGRRSSVGMIFTDREGEGDDYNRVLGADFDWKPTERLAVSGFYARSSDSDLDSGDDWSGGAEVEWTGSIWSWNTGYVEIAENFEPDVGFLLRRDVERYTGEVEYEPRPDIAGVRNLAFELEAEAFVKRDGTTESSELQLEPFGIRFDSEDRLRLFVEHNFERLFEPFEIVPGVEAGA